VDRALLFSLWIQASKNAQALVLALEAIAAGQATVFQNGGRTMISASVAGKSFNYQVTSGITPVEVAKAALDGWRLVSGKTDAEVTAIFTGDQTLVTYPRFVEKPFSVAY
jgi:hypothetical protein